MKNNVYSWALGESFKKLNPKTQIKNPVMFIVYLGAILSTVLIFIDKSVPIWFSVSISILLWLTILFANFAEAIAEGRGKAQADSLKQAKKEVTSYKINTLEDIENNNFTEVISTNLKKGDLIYVKAGWQIPADGDVVNGAASVDESAITGESAPVIRESGGDRSAVTGGTTVVSDFLVIKVTSEDGDSFLDKMISMVEGSARKKTPNEIGLQIFLIMLTIIFLAVSMSLIPFTKFSSNINEKGSAISIIIVIALLICLSPTTIGALVSSIGIAGMSRLTKENVIATSGRAIEAAGDVDVLLLDKTGTITLGNRRASEFYPVEGVSEKELADAAQLSSLADETAEGRSIVVLAKEKFGFRGRELEGADVEIIDFSAKTRISGINYEGNKIRKGAADTIKKYVEENGGTYPSDCDELVEKVAKVGGTPLVVVINNKVLGVVYLKDIIKNGVKEQFKDLRKMGIKTIMITGDNPVTAAAIAAEAGVDDFLAEATPENKMSMIRDYQEKGHLVAMTGDGTNDAPALAQADVGMAMNTGTQAAKEAGNMIDLDSSPTKLVKVVYVGKQLLMTRGALTTFSISNDIAKYFAVIPVLFYGIYPELSALNFMRLSSPFTAILSAVIYNALIIVALIPLALKGVKYQEKPASKILRDNLLLYGVGGIVAPFIAIKLIDIILSLFII